MELPVPHFSSEGNVRRSLNDDDKRAGAHTYNDNMFNILYNSSEQSDSLSPSKIHIQGSYAEVSTNFPREEVRSHGFHHSTSYPEIYSMSDGSFAAQDPSEKPMRHPSCPHSFHSHGFDETKKESVAGQKIPPSKQIEDCKIKASHLRKELETLKEQRIDLRGDGQRSPSPDTKRFLKENTKLQMEIHNKLKTINNVLNVLNGDHSDSQDPLSPEQKHKQKWSQKFNYMFYDPEMHWCRVCNVFPQTAKDYLSHLHSPDHQTAAAEHAEAPWHGALPADPAYPSLPGAPTKRTPIRGLQFFVPATAWFCKLCDQFIGDQHCASAHIKSIIHSKNYNKFVQQNPHWETDWVSDRQRAYERARADRTTRADRTVTSARDDACVQQHVKYVTQTLTISKDIHTKRPPKTPPLELAEQDRYTHGRELARSSQELHDRSESDSEETKLTDKILSEMEMDVDTEERGSPSRSENRLSEEETNLLMSLKNKTRKRDGRQRSPSRDRERSREMQQRMKDSERRGGSSERRTRNRDPARAPRDRSRDRGRRPRDKRGGSRDWRGSRERKGGSRDRKDGSRDRRDSRERKGGSRERKDGSRDNKAGTRDWQSESQAAETKQLRSPQLAGVHIPLPMPSAAMPKPVAAPSPAGLPLPVMMPPHQDVAGVPPGSVSVSAAEEFRIALEKWFPTDPAICALMLNAMQHQQQQPSLLGPAPPLPLAYPLCYPGVVPYDLPTGLLPPIFPHLTVKPLPANRKKPYRPKQSFKEKEDKQTNNEDQNSELEMLGIDKSDVGAGI